MEYVQIQMKSPLCQLCISGSRYVYKPYVAKYGQYRILIFLLSDEPDLARFSIFLLLAPVAQLDRALASEAKGQRFEFSRARHLANFVISNGKKASVVPKGYNYQEFS